MNPLDYKQQAITFIQVCYTEDIGDGDHTTLACVSNNEIRKAKLLVKQRGILAGVELTKWLIETLAPQLTLDMRIKDGDQIQPGDIAFYLEGSAQHILMIERLLLNFMQRMSGIATSTHSYTERIKDLPTKVLDTRKTTPGLRFFEKWAVQIGGGNNHRFGLYDMIMIKDNHVDYAGGIQNAIQKVNHYLKHHNKNLKIEIEVRNLKELNEVLRIGNVHRIMLDNFSIEETQKAVQIIDNKYETESSGGINLDTIRSYAECGVDYISIGALTHQIKSLDLSLKAI